MPERDERDHKRIKIVGIRGREPKTHLVALGVMLVAVTALHLYTDPSLGPLHLLYRRLYYIPIFYAAFVFGIRGGVATAIAASVLIVPTVLMGAEAGDLFDGVNEIAMYLLIGGLFGWMRAVEDSRTEDLHQVGVQLEQAYARLEERAVELVTIQEYTSSILQSITAAVVTVGPDGSVATVNTAGERMLGVPERDMAPKPFSMVVQDDGGVSGEIAKVLEGRVPRTVRDTIIRTHGGRELHVQAAVSRMQATDGRIFGAVVTMEDVSEVKTLTAQLLRADRLAALGELTTGVAHEVRNPLGIIRATIQLLGEQCLEPTRVDESVSIITQEVDRLDRVVKALLDFGRPWTPTLMRGSVNRLLEEVVLFTDKWASRSDVDIDVTYAEDLPQIMLDPHQIKQVFVNLISNAVQSMELEGGRLAISTELTDGFVAIRFTDDGLGLDTETVHKVFDPFFSTREDGTGLGLAIVHRIVDDHHGHIELSRSQGEGAVFTVNLPVHAWSTVSQVSQGYDEVDEADD